MRQRNIWCEPGEQARAHWRFKTCPDPGMMRQDSWWGRFLKTLFGLALALAGLVGCTRAETTVEGDSSAGHMEAAQGGAVPELAPPASAPGGQRGQGMAYEIVGTEVWNVPDPASGRDYQVFVSVPPSYADEPERRYPVLYVTDADYAFPLVRGIARRLNVEGPVVEEFILVGLSYALGDEPMTSRRRDYTPTSPRHGAPAGGDPHGGGDAYVAYLRDQVIPFVAGRYRSDEGRRMLLGHSYGALLATQVLFSDPALFSGYVLGSPSYWYDGGVMDAFERTYAEGHDDLDASIYMYVGEYERPAHGKRYDMVGDARRMAASLGARRYPSLRIRLDVLDDEDHLSVAPRGFTHGLNYLMAVQ